MSVLFFIGFKLNIIYWKNTRKLKFTSKILIWSGILILNSGIFASHVKQTIINLAWSIFFPNKYIQKNKCLIYSSMVIYSWRMTYVYIYTHTNIHTYINILIINTYLFINCGRATFVDTVTQYLKYIHSVTHLSIVRLNILYV